MKLLDIQFIYVDIAMRSVLFLRSAIFLPSLRLIDLRNAEIFLIPLSCKACSATM